MNGHSTRTHPRTVALTDGPIELRMMGANDGERVLAFARELPAHDLLFLPRDITHPKVMTAWIAEIERGAMTTVLALRDGNVLGNVTIVRDPLSWSPHVGELRVVTSPAMRGKGLGRLLAEDAFALAVDMGIEKFVAYMTTDQRGAIAVFEGMGYRGEALLRDHVKDRDGLKHDIVILSHDVANIEAQLQAFGLTEVFD